MPKKMELYLDEVRRQNGLLTMGEIIELSEQGNIIYDPYSVLISKDTVIGCGNVFFPNVCLFCSDKGTLLSVGDNNIFYSDTLLEASHGTIQIGDANQFGEGGFVAKANRIGATIKIGSTGRYLGGVSVFGNTVLGSGSQLLGAIMAENCILEEGGDFRNDNPDMRAGLLKGSGIARGITVPVGHVIANIGSFSLSDLQKQSVYH